MLAVLNPGETITAVMSGAAATTNPVYSTSWWEGESSDQSVGSLNGTTAVTVVNEPNGGARIANRVTIYNGDTAAVTVTISKVVDGTIHNLSKTVMPVGSTLTVDARGVHLIDTNGQQLTSSAVLGGTAGTSPVSTVVAVDAPGVVQHTILTLTDLLITVGNTTLISFGNVKVYDFPAGRILVLGAQFDSITFDFTHADNNTPIDGADGGDISFGTTGTANSTLDGTDVDIVPKAGADPLSGGFAGAALAASAQFDGTSTAKDIYLNVIIDDDDVADAASDVLKVSGVLEFHWLLLGDY